LTDWGDSVIPANGFLNEDFEVVEQPSHTFYLDIDKNIVFGFTDNIDAMKQAIYLILETERYQYVIFSWNYGIELLDLFGKQMTFVLPEIKRRVTEALLQDTRVQRLEDFDFQVDRNKVLTTFTAVTIFGNIRIERVVMI
jgi:hypothetical protein